MPNYCIANERIKRACFISLEEENCYGERSLDVVAAASNSFEAYNLHSDSKSYHIQQAVGYKNKLATWTNAAAG